MEKRAILRSVLPLSLATLLLLMTGCAQVATYDPSYISSQASGIAPKSDGKVLVYTDSADDQYEYSGHPDSFTGGGTTLTFPSGKVTREIAKTVFSRVFAAGASTSNTLTNSDGGYALIVQPHLVSFHYAYNGLKNAGFAVTPQVQMVLHISVMTSNRQPLFEHQYDSGLVDGETYFMSTAPGDEISKTAHKVLFDLMEKAANDTVDAWKKKQVNAFNAVNSSLRQN